MSELLFTDVISAIVDNRGRTCPVVDHGRPLIATNCITEEALYPIYETTRFVSDETYQTWFRGHPEPGDIIFVCKGKPGTVALVPDPVDFCIAQDMVAIRADESKIYPKFLFALLRSQLIRERIDALHVGTMIPHFKKGDFSQLKLPVVERSLQVSVGDFYFDVSNKIESNRRLSRTGVQLARTMLLEGDTRVRLGDVANCEKGLSYKGDGLVEGSDSGLPMINLGNFTTTGWLVPDKLKFYRGEYKERHLVQPGDVVVANTDLTQQRVIIGRPALVPPALGKAIFSHHVTAVRPLTDEKLRLPIWAQLNSQAFRERAEGFATGTTVAGMPVEALLDFEIELPKDSLVAEAQTLLERVWVAETETADLTRTRDTLLPALLSGALRVRDAEKIVEEAV